MIGAIMFQFHKGAIRTWNLVNFLCQLLRFNSIKVRLELTIRNSDGQSLRFQFHKGAIRTKQLDENKADRDVSIP